MAKPRSKLSELLNEICRNVYFQPPADIKMKYPCIVYELEKTDVTRADNNPYLLYDMYSLKYITRDPDDANRLRFITIPLCTSQKMYIADNLYHHPFELYW